MTGVSQHCAAAAAAAVAVDATASMRAIGLAPVDCNTETNWG